jgi:hypothetical protein
MRRILFGLLLAFSAFPCFAAKDNPFQVLNWPESGSTRIRFTFSKLKEEVGGVGKEHPFVTDTTAENLSGDQIGTLSLLLYVYDKTHARIGEGSINLSNVGPNQTVKFEVNLFATGTPASLSLAANTPRAVSITVNSIPQGANFTLDGRSMGTTPKMAEVTIGKHVLTFSKDGYNTGSFPLEMGPRDTSGGSVSFELGTSAHDTIELRDGSVLSGDLLSMDGQQVQIRIGGASQTYSRNQIKRVSLVQRDPVTQ